MKYIVAIILLLTVLSCEKSTTDCTYQIACTEEVEKDGAKLLLSEVVGFVFYADTAIYTPKSYDEAISGSVSNKSGGEAKKADVSGTYDSATGVLTMPNLSKIGKSIFVVCDIKNKLYSFRQYKIEANLPQITTTLIFTPYAFTGAVGEQIKSSGWIQNL